MKINTGSRGITPTPYLATLANNLSVHTIRPNARRLRLRYLCEGTLLA
jgi:hypothetical protein